MSTVLLLAVLAVFDGGLMGFRAAAGRSGLLDKRAYYRAAITQAVLATLGIVAAHGALAAILCATSADPSGTFGALVETARPIAIAFAGFASVALVAFAFYFAPVGDFRVLANVVVLGPFTIARPWVIAAGCGTAALTANDPRASVLAISAGVAMIASEHVLARRYASAWRSLVGEAAAPPPSRPG